MASELAGGIRSEAEDLRDKSRFQVGQRVAVNIGGCPENRTEGTITEIHALPTLTTYEVRFDGYDRHAGVDTRYMAQALSPLEGSAGRPL